MRLTPRRTLLVVAVITLLALAALAAGMLLRGAPRATFVREEPCPESRFTCITLRVPRDHFGAADGPTFDVTFGLLRASQTPRKGVWVTITGGPGTAGLASADSYTDTFDPAIVEQYDIVFLDQRGVGQSEPIQCPEATLAYYTTEALPTLSDEQAAAFAVAAGRYAEDCVEESGIDRADLPYFSTRQAVEDLEAFRLWLKADKLDLYGESYGTQYAQTYAAAHPEHLHSLFIDGAVDLTLTGLDYYIEDVSAYEETLLMTLDRCTQDPVCSADVDLGPRRGGSGDALATFDGLVERLPDGPIAYDFVDASGEIQRRTFSLGDLETATAGYLGSTADRMLLQRAIAQASHGNLLPLARMLYVSLGQDPETLEAVPDPSWSDGMYYAVQCMDYAYGTGSAAERVAAYLAAEAAANVDAVRLGSIAYEDLPCASWPVHPASQERPAYLTDTPFPVFVLNSSTDPATPYAGALRIFDHLADGYLVTTPGGPHVLFGRGESCPDELVTAFLVDDELPADRRTECDFIGTQPYVPIPAATVDEYATTLDALIAMDDEINWNVDYWEWYGDDTLTFGCWHGGTISYEASDAGYAVALDACAFSAGLPLTGSASINDDGSFDLSATTAGDSQLTYSRDVDGNQAATGTLPP